MPQDFGEDAQKVGGGVQTQTDETAEELYSLVNLKGGGELVELTRKAIRTKNYADVEARIRRDVPKYLYNGGEGKEIPIKQLVERREQERQKNMVKKEKKRHLSRRTNSVSMMSLMGQGEFGYDYPDGVSEGRSK